MIHLASPKQPLQVLPHVVYRESMMVKFFLLFMGMFLNMQKDMFGYNLSFADIIAVCLVIIFSLSNYLLIETKTTLFFLWILTVSLIIGNFYIPEKYYFAISLQSSLADYLKVAASFLYFTLGMNIAIQKRVDYVLNGYVFMAVILAIISILANILAIPIFRINFFFFGDRFIGLLNDPNYFALAQCGCLTLLLFDQRIKSGRKTLFSFIVMISILFSASKTGFITMIMVLLFFLLAHMNEIKRRVMVATITVLSLITGFIWMFPEKVAALYFSLLGQYPMFERVTVLFSDINAAISDGGSSRTVVWEGGITLIKENPMTGVGIGRYIEVVEKVMGVNLVAHNTYIQVIAEWGFIPGVILFGTCFYVCVAGFWRGHKGLSAFFLVWLIGSLSISLNNSRIFWITFGFLFALTFMKEKAQNRNRLSSG